MIKNTKERALHATLALVTASALNASAQTGGGLIETTEVTFQQGLDGYDGTFQKRVGPTVDELGEDTFQYYLDGSALGEEQNDTLDLIRFDDITGDGLNQIPEGATILRAELIYNTGTDGNAQTDGPYQIGRLGVEINNNTTYDSLNASNTEDLPELRAARGVIVGDLLAGYAEVAQQEVVSANVAPIVQAWVDGEENFGFTVFANDTNNGWQIATIGNEDVAKRPMLQVEYTTEALTLKEFKATQSALVVTDQPTIDGSTLAAEFLDLDSSTTWEALLLFGEAFGNDSAQIGLVDQIVHAELVMRTAGRPDWSTNADTDDPYTIHPILIDWDVTSTFGPTGLSETQSQIAPSIGQLNGMGENTRVSANVTEVVQQWKSGLTNYGITLRPVGEDGWQPYWPGANDPTLTPTLRIWTVEVAGVPEASFTASPTEGPAPLTVTFDASASLDPNDQTLEYDWDFGDGTTGSGMTVTHDYPASGTYNVTLSVTDPDGNIGQAFETVKSLGAPMAVLNTITQAGSAPFTFTGNAAGSLDQDGGSVEFLWEFGTADAYTAATTESVRFVYDDPGIYTLTLNVTDDEGETDTIEQEISVYPSSIESLVLQQGLNGYQGTFEKRIRLGDDLSEMGADVGQYYLDGRPQDSNQINNDTVELIRFDGIADALPNNATVVRATITYTTGDDANANSDGPYVIGRLETPVDEDTLYSDLDTVQDFPDDRGPRSHLTSEYYTGTPDILAGFADIANEEVVSADVTLFVRDWLEGEVENEGMVIFTDDTSNGWQIRTIGAEEVSERPKLSIDYVTPNVEEYVFSAEESMLFGPTQDEQDGNAIFEFFLDGGADLKESVYWFEDLFEEISLDRERIINARFDVRTTGVRSFLSGNADSDDPYFLSQVLVDWVEEGYEFGPNGLTIEDGERTVPVGEFIGMGEEAWASVDITPILYNWGVLQQPNYGIGVSPGGADGWQLFFSGVRDEREPRLVILTEARNDQPEVITPFPRPTPNPADPMITSHALDPENISLTFVSTEGAAFAVDASKDLLNWETILSDIVGTGDETTIQIPIGGNTIRFFRIRVQ